MTITNKEDLEAHEDVRNDMRREKKTEKDFEWVFPLRETRGMTGKGGK